MAAGNRAELLKSLHKALKKQTSPTVLMERTVLEHFIFATCLEDAGFEAAETAFVALKESLSGWNEVRVSSPAELTEMMPQLPDARGAAIRVKKILNAVFEERYSFNLDDLRKMNLSVAFTKLESIPGGTPFSTAYTAQVALGRHGIPVGTGEKRLLYVLGILEEEELDKREVAGLNRAITKQQGPEFMSLLHAVAADFVLNPNSRKMAIFMKAFAPDYKTRLAPRREVKEENLLETPPLPEVRGSRQYSKKELAAFLKQEMQEEDAQLDPVSNEIPQEEQGQDADKSETEAAPAEKSGRSRKSRRGGAKPVAATPLTEKKTEAPAAKKVSPKNVPDQKTPAEPVKSAHPVKRPSVPSLDAKKKTPQKPAPKAAPSAAKKSGKEVPAAKKPVAKKAPEKKVVGKQLTAGKSAVKKAPVKAPVKKSAPAAKTPARKAVTSKPTAGKANPVKKTVKNGKAVSAPPKKAAPKAKIVPVKKAVKNAGPAGKTAAKKVPAASAAKIVKTNGKAKAGKPAVKKASKKK